MQIAGFGRNILSVIVAAVLTTSLTGCATWSTSSVDTSSSSTPIAEVKSTTPDKIQIFQGDITDRKYRTLGDITVTVRKTTLFHDDPTKEDVKSRLREEAAKLGADAVVFVRYGKVGVSAWSYGSLEGKGRAVKFIP